MSDGEQKDSVRNQNCQELVCLAAFKRHDFAGELIALPVFRTAGEQDLNKEHSLFRAEAGTVHISGWAQEL